MEQAGRTRRVSPRSMFNVRERIASQWAVAKKHLMLVLLSIGLLWVVFFIQLAVPESWFDFKKLGIRPQTPEGLLSILIAPVLHVEFRCLFAVTLPLLVLCWLLMVTDRRLLLRVVVVTSLTSGAGVWVFGRDAVILSGAGGVLSGLLGFLATRGWLARRVFWALVALGVGLFYFGELLLLPFATGVSWSSHFWGLAGGIVMAWWMYGRTPVPAPVAPQDMRRQ
jgi:membrane associated rhomboid family serine protease